VSGTPPESRRSLAVVPLIGDQRYYGETTARLRRGSLWAWGGTRARITFGTSVQPSMCWQRRIQIRTAQSRAPPWREAVLRTVTRRKAKLIPNPAVRIWVHLRSSVVLFCTDAAKSSRITPTRFPPQRQAGPRQPRKAKMLRPLGYRARRRWVARACRRGEHARGPKPGTKFRQRMKGKLHCP